LTTAVPAAKAVVLGALLLCACTAALVTADAPKDVHGHRIAPFEWHDECMHMAAGDRVEYAFESSAPVDFNIHYREGKMVIMPLVRERTRADAGVFAPLSAQDYCLTWEAGRAGALIDYRIRLTQFDG